MQLLSYVALALIIDTTVIIHAFSFHQNPSSVPSIIFDRTTFLSCSTSNTDITSIEPYVGPVGNIADMEGGIAVEELALNVLTGPSLVASGGRGLFLCIYDDDGDDDEDEDYSNNTEYEGAVEEIIIPQGTPICGYARGYFTDQQEGDKSVGFLFNKENSANVTAVFYNQKLMTLGDAVWSVYNEEWRAERAEENNNTDTDSSNNLLFGHTVTVNADTGDIEIKADQEFLSRIFIPDTPEENQFAATSLGVYANDLAYDPNSNETQYFENSEKNNILELVWRLAKDEITGTLVPTWPVVVARQDFRLLNTVPMEVGLQYGYNYWNAVAKEGTSKYIISD